jgi:flagellar motor switch protein FliM
VIDFTSKSNGIIDVVYPYSALKNIRELLESRVQASSETNSSKLSWTADLMGATMDAEVEIKVTLGQLKTSFKDFENLAEGDILFFKKPDHATASAAGMPLFLGDLGTMDSHMAIQFVKPSES